MYFHSNASSVVASRTGVLIDNDLLGLIYGDKEALKEVLNVMNGKKMFLYPFTEFEFLRDVFVPQEKKLKEKFINSNSFGHISAEKHAEILEKIIENALILSKLLAHQKQGQKSKNNASIVDLMLAAFLMYLKDHAILITGNSRDFPSCVFDILGILNLERNDSSIRVFSVVCFNQKKFDECFGELNKLEEKDEEIPF